MIDPIGPGFRARLNAAITRAPRAHPGPVGLALVDSLTTWRDFGYRLGGRSLTEQIVDAVLKEPLPGTEERAHRMRQHARRVG